MRLSVFSSQFAADAALVTALMGSLVNPIHARIVSSEADEASITNGTEECQVYGYQPVTDALDGFPTIWEPATIVSTDTDALNMWANISQSIPTDILPQGTIEGVWNTTPAYDTATDPDCWWTKTQCTHPKITTIPADVSIVPEPMTMGYAFDDGPNCSHNVFYDYLAEQNQKATMFFIGSNVLDWPFEAMRALDEGHEICAHTWSHHYMTGFTSEDAFAELYYSVKAIKLVLGVTVTCWRPPFGDVDDRIRSIAEALGLRTIIWQYDSFDWEEQSGNITAAQVDANYQTFITRAQNGSFNDVGSIMLTHELNNFTMQTAMDFYPQLQTAFKYMVPVGVALNKTQPYVETNYSLPTFEQYIGGITTVNGSSSSSSSSSGSSGSSSSSSTSSSSGASALSPISTALFVSVLGLLAALS